jgi:hypothetical protein
VWQKLIQITVTALVSAVADKIVTPLYRLIKDGFEMATRKKKAEQAAKEVQNADSDQATIDAANKLP